jgi:hypothetical protein
MMNQLSYYYPDTVTGGAHLGWSLPATVVSLDGDFFDNGAMLKDNATGRGDVTVGPPGPVRPDHRRHSRPGFVQRMAFDTILPTGKYDKQKNLNPGFKHFSLTPYWAATGMPVPRVEVSWRLDYL